MGNKISIEIITEPRIYDVEPGYFAGSPGRIRVDVCKKCAAVVWNPVEHDDWHRQHERAALATEEGKNE